MPTSGTTRFRVRLRPLFHHLRAVLTSFALISGVVGAAEDANGLLIDTGYEQVRAQCGACHSLRLVTQNRSDRDGWLAMIRWMQDSQGLWPLGENEPIILDYLAAHYGPVATGRRKPLEVTFE